MPETLAVRRSKFVRLAAMPLTILVVTTGCASAAAATPPMAAPAPVGGIRNIVLTHGAWVDGSGWKGVYDMLLNDGYNVSIVQEPLTSFQEDVAATRRVLAVQDGPTILVGHSYGGSVITEAGTDAPVAGLVYVAAHMPDTGETEAGDGLRFPSDLSRSTAIQTSADGFEVLDAAQFRDFFAADLTASQTDFMAHSQVPIAATNFHGVITRPAWRSKESWAIVAGSDRTINPDLERWYAARANSHTVEISGASHSVYISQPRDVAAVIEEAASQLNKNKRFGSSGRSRE